MIQLAERIAGRPFPSNIEGEPVTLLSAAKWLGDLVLGAGDDFSKVIDEVASMDRHNPDGNIGV